MVDRAGDTASFIPPLNLPKFQDVGTPPPQEAAVKATPQDMQDELQRASEEMVCDMIEASFDQNHDDKISPEEWAAAPSPRDSDDTMRREFCKYISGQRGEPGSGLEA